MYFTVFLSSEGEGCPGGGDSEHLTEFSALHCRLETPAGVGGMSAGHVLCLQLGTGKSFSCGGEGSGKQPRHFQEISLRVCSL